MSQRQQQQCMKEEVAAVALPDPLVEFPCECRLVHPTRCAKCDGQVKLVTDSIGTSIRCHCGDYRKYFPPIDAATTTTTADTEGSINNMDDVMEIVASDMQQVSIV